MPENITAGKLCTCTNFDCLYHPTNHEKGCTPCVAANLKTNDLPRCFFEKLGAAGAKDTSFHAFAEAVLSKEVARKDE